MNLFFNVSCLFWEAYRAWFVIRGQGGTGTDRMGVPWCLPSYGLGKEAHWEHGPEPLLLLSSLQDATFPEVLAAPF